MSKPHSLPSTPNDHLGFDVEKDSGGDARLMNTAVKHFAWRDIAVTVTDRTTKLPRALLQNVSGIVKAGEMCALMGPSGCGKTMLLNVLARRVATAGGEVDGATLVNGQEQSQDDFRRISSYVEEENSLIGSLTVRETLTFASKLSNSKKLSKAQHEAHVDYLLASFGVMGQQDTIIGTPIRKGISSGQKKRVSVASQLITAPKLLFLDEPTSGLDSAASFEVMSFIKKIAKENNLIVIASIHQPSSSTFEQFDNVLLLSKGRPHYFGSKTGIAPFFDLMNHPIPPHMNPGEFMLELVNTDFSSNQETSKEQLDEMHEMWETSINSRTITAELDRLVHDNFQLPPLKATSLRPKFSVLLRALVHRSFIKSYRDIFAYGIRLAMYTGLAIMMGTVWFRLGSSQLDIQAFINAIFFGGAFMSFMAVAYVPAYLEDRATFIRERSNGLYGALPFLVSNWIIGIPYLFLISLIFSLITYWLTGYEPSSNTFFMWILWLFLDLIAAESLVVLMSSLFPNFVVSLALTSFVNGLFMSVGGFLAPPAILNVFWYYGFSFIDYQRWVFQGMMVNQFENQVFDCDANCNCMYQTDLASQCQIAGSGILDAYGYETGREATWIGILVGITAAYRLLAWFVLAFRK